MLTRYQTALCTALLATAAFPGCNTKPPATIAPTHTNLTTTPDLPDVKPLIPHESGHYLFEDKIKPGMKGYGLTVMTGGKIERFDIEVIDVVQNFSPATNAILVRCSGLGLEHSGIIAGMSGSPCFIDNKMIGAVAFGWGMAKDPIAGVQPIRQMLAINPDAAKLRPDESSANAPSHLNPALLLSAKSTPGWNKLLASITTHNRESANGRGGESATPPGMRRLVSPLMVSGLSPNSMKLLEQQLEGTGLIPISSGGGGGTQLGGIGDLKPNQIHLEPGSAIAIPLLTGDFDMSAIGTVTEVQNGKVYAFGHSFNAEGITRLPIATGYIYTVMPNVNQSFKMGASLANAGTLVMDEQTGIVGLLGEAPPTVPITISVKDGELPNKTFHYQLAPHPKLTPIILNSILNETLSAQRALPPQYTVRITGEATFTADGNPDPIKIKVNNLGSTDGFREPMTLLPVMVLTDNPFERLHLANFTIQTTIEHTNHGAAIRSVSIDRTTVAPGDEIHAVAEIESFRKELTKLPITFRIPADAPDGDFELLVGSAGMALSQESDYAPTRFDPQNITALEEAVKKIEGYDPEKIYVRLVLGISGASIAGNERNNLPVSRIAIYASPRRGNTAPVMRAITETTPANALIENGGQTFTLHINHKANERYFSTKNPDNSGGPSSQGSHPKILDQPAPASEPSDGG